MYRREHYTGADLPSKHLCLTYDDGPGQHTYEIAKFLYEHNIQATFFVVGKYAIHQQDDLSKVSDMGHLIGNHTYEHPDMPYYLSINGDVVNQILRTDAIIKKFTKEDTIFFRSPYGKWSNEVANELNLNILSTINHIGPIYWDIGGIDCYYWRNGHSVDYVVNKYLSDIEDKGKGIIVMHDGIADMNYLKERNDALELTKQLIPLLKLKGYKFVRLDEIESIKKDACQVFKFTLRCTNGNFVTLCDEENYTILTKGKPNKVLNEISLKELGHGKIALKASNGMFFSLQDGGECLIRASSSEVKNKESFDLIPVSSNQIILRADNGNYLAKETKQPGRLLAAAEFMRGAEIFKLFPQNIQAEKKITMYERVSTLKRQILYVKSKIQQATK